ncbi:hypothetical protein D7M11_07575 [Paenibacillus ginsengarvi]|uniref:Uncharacterized protein n=1 Tax=Paenibacillus ginsengarvi TaxID=400777 RepID=A0A3B0CLA5_9BACL|nr:hypothetical protein D7M11_07575 [Paenibacillus ginsengarvi]
MNGMDQPSTNKENAAGSGKTTNPGTSPQPKPSDTAPVRNEARPSVREHLKRIAFSEETENAARMIEQWQTSDSSSLPAKVVHQWERVTIHLEWSDADEAGRNALLDQITIGDKKPVFERDRADSNQYRLRLEQPVGASFEVRLGDLPPIRVERMKSLSFKPVSAAGEAVANVLHIPAREYGSRLFIPAEETGIVLQFSEVMEPRLPIAAEGSLVQAEWTDSTHLLLRFDQAAPSDGRTSELTLRFGDLQAASGNRLQDEMSVIISRFPALAWKDSLTGQQAVNGSRDRYYDRLLLSPDGTKYVGVIGLGGAMGDGDGWSYAFVLERPGKEPIVLERVFYSTIEPDDTPIRWIDSNTLLYASYYGVYAYDTEALTRRTVHENDPGETRNINNAVWDPYRRQLYVLAYGDRDESGMTNLYTYRDTNGPPQVDRGVSESVLAAKYSMLDLSIFPAEDGVYWTRTQSGVPYTEFVRSDGTRFTVKGIVRVVTVKGAYVQMYAAGGYYLTQEGWSLWRPGSSEKPVASPPGFGIAFRSGDELMYEEDGRFYRYDPEQDEWPLWRAPGGEEQDAVPNRGPDKLYKAFVSR